MILKIIENDCVCEREVVTIYDDVATASMYFDKEQGKNMASVAFRNGLSMILPINKTSYLCNDEGKTIEKLLPALKKD
jgi:hypothetical protein